MTLTAYRENKFPLFLNRVYPQSVDVSCDLSSTSPLTRILLRTAAYYHKKLTEFLFVQSGFPLELPFPRFVTSPQLLHARPTGTHPCRANTLCLANQPYSRRLLCSSGLGFRIIAAPRGLSPQCAYRVGRTKKSLQLRKLQTFYVYFSALFTLRSRGRSAHHPTAQL